MDSTEAILPKPPIVSICSFGWPDLNGDSASCSQVLQHACLEQMAEMKVALARSTVSNGPSVLLTRSLIAPRAAARICSPEHPIAVCS